MPVIGSMRGPAGPQGQQGVQGGQGVAGPPGTPGAPGAAGKSISAGAALPANTEGQDGDLFILTTTGDLYQKTSGAW